MVSKCIICKYNRRNNGAGLVVFKLQFFERYHTYMRKKEFTMLGYQVKSSQLTSKLYQTVTKYIIFK
jgi:hypothetical protein